MSVQFNILNAISEGACVTDLQGDIIFWNQRLHYWTGLTSEELIGKNIFDTFDKFKPPHIKMRIDMLQKNATPIIFSAQLHGHLIPCPLPDGSLRIQQTTLTLLDDSEHILLTIQDFTEHIQLHAKQKEINSRLQNELQQKKILEHQQTQLISAMDQAAESIIIVNISGHIEYMNQTFSKETGWSQDEVLNKITYQSLHAKQHDSFEQQIITTMRSNKAWQGRQKIKRKDGSLFMANISIAPIIIDPEQQVRHAVIIQEDISQQLTLEEQYRNIQKREALSTLVGGIAHDFNNLLAGILGNLYLASREVKELPKTAKRLERIQSAANDAADIVKQLMTFSHGEQIEECDFPLDSFLKEINKVIKHSVPENIHFTLDFAHEKYSMHGNADHLQQTIMNIVQNAVEACQKQANPEIHMQLAIFSPEQHPDICMRHPKLQQGEYAHITIQDNGCGIHLTHQDRVFDPFFTTKQMGSGLGLATALGIIRHHNGVIEIDSILNQGTSVHIYLPLKSKNIISNDNPKELSQEVHILLVDDNALVRETCAEMLQSLAYKVTLARDGQEAVEIFNKHSDRFNIIIMDMIMPRLGGLDAAHQIRQKNAETPIIFATGYDQSISIKGAKKFEHSILISKPFHPHDLQKIIASFLHQEP